MSHPRDEWVTYHPGGSADPITLLVQDGVAAEIAELEAAYVAGRITVEQLEQQTAEALATVRLTT